MQEFQYIQDILKEFYAPAIVNQVYKKAPWWAQIKKLTKGVYGKRIVIPVMTAFTEAVGARVANNYALPTAKKNTYDQAYIYMKRNYGRIQVDGFAIESAKNRGGWVDIVTAETKGVSNAFALDVDRQSLGRGDGVLGHVASTSGSTITVDNPFGITEASVARLFRAGMTIDGYDDADSTQHVDSLEISSISGNTLTMSASTGISDLADGDQLYREDVFSTTPGNIGEMMGLDGIVDTGNGPSPSTHVSASDFEGIDASAEPTWQSYVDSTSQVISETVIQELLDSIEKRTDGEKPNLAITTYALRNKLIEIMQSDRLIQTMDLKAGWKAIKYIGGNVELPIMVHKNCPTGYFYVVSLPHIKFYTLKKLVWDNKGGGIVKPVAGYDAYEAWFKMYGNIGTDCRNAHGKLTGLTTS
ncbi:MAG: phage major capsid protein [Deltaproteobacteria bacterium]|nr:phage major capsid protein [Deltaproteobacteria bacterium]